MMDKINATNRHVNDCRYQGDTLDQRSARRESFECGYDEASRMLASQSKLLDELAGALEEAHAGLESCYQVVDYPADGSSSQDGALSSVGYALSSYRAYKSNGGEVMTAYVPESQSGGHTLWGRYTCKCGRSGCPTACQPFGCTKSQYDEATTYKYTEPMTTNYGRKEK